LDDALRLSSSFPYLLYAQLLPLQGNTTVTRPFWALELGTLATSPVTPLWLLGLLPVHGPLLPPAGGSEALRVELTGGLEVEEDTMVRATAIAMCHGNTRSWDARYFQMLNATRGEEVCHFMPLGYLLWLPAVAL